MAKESLTGDETERINTSFLNQRNLPKREKYQGRQPTRQDRAAAAAKTQNQPANKRTISTNQESAAALRLAAEQTGIQVDFNQNQATFTNPGDEPQKLSTIVEAAQELNKHPTTPHLAAPPSKD